MAIGTDIDTPRSERDQTDDSLRLEREKVDEALADELAVIDETADAVISVARARADGVLRAARAAVDRQAAPASPGARSAITRERAHEDRALRDERATADETLRVERAATVGLLATERNETDKDLLTERARADNALATRDEFLGIVSHDLRHMLNGMVGFASLISKAIAHGGSTEDVLRYAQRIQRSGGRMERLIGDLVDVASIEAGRLAVTRQVGDPSSVIAEAVETFQSQAAAGGVSLATEMVQPPGLVVAFDPARILQVITNLLSNAIKFTPAGGDVVVRIESIDGMLRISVLDTGVGIPADQLEEVFVRFLQLAAADRRGVGLGLFISRCIVQGHGGRIWAENRPERGAAFRFTLPTDLS